MVAARDVKKLKGLAGETGAKIFAVEASDASAVAKLFLDTERLLAEPDVVIYNAGSRVSGKLADLDPAAVERCVTIERDGVGASRIRAQFDDDRVTEIDCRGPVCLERSPQHVGTFHHQLERRQQSLDDVGDGRSARTIV